MASLRHGEELGCGPSCNIINPELSAARTTLPDDSKAMPRAGDQKAPDSRQTAELELSYRYAAQQKRPWGDSTGWRGLWEADRSSELKEVNARSAQLPQNGRRATANRYALSAMGGVVGETLVNGFGLVSHNCFPHCLTVHLNSWEVLPLAAFWTCHVYGFIMLLLFSHQLIVILWKTKLNKTNE